MGDEAFQQKCFATFEWFEREGKTIVLVSHDLDSVLRFCSRAMLLNRGSVQAFGGADEVVTIYKGEPSPLAART